jgi:cyanophycinase-like exopeptidase
MRGLWSAFLFGVRRQLRDDQFILGVDENTTLVGKLGETWQVMGQGQAHVISRDGQQDFAAGEKVTLGS